MTCWCPKGTNEIKPSAAGKIYELVAALLVGEEDRRKRVEGRAATILTTSTTMLTLIFGLTIFVSGKDYTFRNHCAVWFLTLALAAFVVSSGDCHLHPGLPLSVLNTQRLHPQQPGC